MSDPFSPSQEPQLVGKPWDRRIAKLIQDWMRQVRQLATQPPARHAITHRPGNSDALPTDTPAALGTTAAEGTATTFARSDHVHKRAIETTNGGYVRRRLNFTSGFTVTDDSVNDEIEVAATGSSESAMALALLMGD